MSLQRNDAPHSGQKNQSQITQPTPSPLPPAHAFPAPPLRRTVLEHIRCLRNTLYLRRKQPATPPNRRRPHPTLTPTFPHSRLRTVFCCAAHANVALHCSALCTANAKPNRSLHTSRDALQKSTPLHPTPSASQLAVPTLCRHAPAKPIDGQPQGALAGGSKLHDHGFAPVFGAVQFCVMGRVRRSERVLGAACGAHGCLRRTTPPPAPHSLWADARSSSSVVGNPSKMARRRATSVSLVRVAGKGVWGDG